MGEPTPAGQLAWAQAAGGDGRESGCSPPQLRCVSHRRQHVPDAGDYSPSGSPGSGTHKTSHAQDSGTTHGRAAPRTHTRLGSGPAVSGMLKQAKSRPCQLEKGKGDLGGSRELEEAAWVKQVTAQQPPTLNQNLLLSTRFECPVQQQQLQLPLGLRSRKGYGTAHTHIFSIHF